MDDKEKQMANGDEANSDGIEVRQIWEAVCRYRIRVILAPVLGALLALAVTMLMGEVWEAAAVMRIGQVGQIVQAGQIAQVSALQIEPVMRAVERVKRTGFKNEVLAKLDISPESAHAKHIRDSVKAKQITATDLVEIKLRDVTPVRAAELAEAMAHHLQGIHEELAASSIARLARESAAIEARIERLRTERDRIVEERMSNSRQPGHALFSQNVLSANVLALRESELRQLEDSKLMLEEQLSPLRTFPTALIGPIEISDQPVSPKSGLIVAIGTVIGLIAGVTVAVIRARRAS